MYRPKPIPPIRLEKLDAVPDPDRLMALHEQVRRVVGRRVELPIVIQQGEYVLAAIVPPGGGDGFPEWGLYEGLGPRAPLMWSHVTGDVKFLHHILVEALTGTSFQDQIEHTVSKEVKQMGFNPSAIFIDGTKSSEWGKKEESDAPAASLEGELKDISPPSLLQSVQLSKLNGLLLVSDGTEEIKIFFVDGAPVHATSIENQGNGSVIELLTWEKGKFKFYPNERTTERTVTKRVDALLMEGITLLDQQTFLSKAGVDMDKYLIRKDPNLGEKEFEERLKKGAPLGLEPQKAFYRMIDSQSTLFELLRLSPKPRSEWVPIMFNMLSCDLIVLSDRPAQSARKNLFYSAPVDRNVIDSAQRVMVRAETGLYTYNFMLFFLEQEFMRFENGGGPFSLILMEMMTRDEKVVEQPKPAVVKEVARRIGLVKRNIDIFGHWETLGYALILPQTDAGATALVAARLPEVIWDATMPGGITKTNLLLACGVGSVPEDCTHMGVLLAGAKEAKERAKRSVSPVVLMRGLEGDRPPVPQATQQKS